MDTWAELADERRLLASELEGLPPAAWETVTMCGGWTVHELTAHLTIPLTISRGEAIKRFATAFGNADKAIAAMTMARTSAPPSELVATIRDKADRKFAPPGLGPVAPLTDAIVHGLELRRAAGIRRAVAPERLRAALDFVTSGRAPGFVPRKRANGLRFETTDLDWSAGPDDAPVVRGPAEDLLLAITGRPAGLETLEGDGVATLASRL